MKRLITNDVDAHRLHLWEATCSQNYFESTMQ